MLVCVVEQPDYGAVHTAAMPVRKIHFNSFVSRNLIIDNSSLTNRFRR